MIPHTTLWKHKGDKDAYSVSFLLSASRGSERASVTWQTGDRLVSYEVVHVLRPEQVLAVGLGPPRGHTCQEDVGA